VTPRGGRGGTRADSAAGAVLAWGLEHFRNERPGFLLLGPAVRTVATRPQLHITSPGAGAPAPAATPPRRRGAKAWGHSAAPPGGGPASIRQHRGARLQGKGARLHPRGQWQETRHTCSTAGGGRAAVATVGAAGGGVVDGAAVADVDVDGGGRAAIHATAATCSPRAPKPMACLSMPRPRRQHCSSELVRVDAGRTLPPGERTLTTIHGVGRRAGCTVLGCRQGLGRLVLPCEEPAMRGHAGLALHGCATASGSGSLVHGLAWPMGGAWWPGLPGGCWVATHLHCPASWERAQR